MVEKICYFVGAGFSAYAGIPTMGNFFDKSRDMYSTDKAKYKSFKKIYDAINQMYRIKGRAYSDLDNIEEVLSLLDMQDNLAKRSSIQFKEFLKRVINYYTAQQFPDQTIGTNFSFQNIFGNKKVFRRYGLFVASLLGIKTSQTELLGQTKRTIESIPHRDYRYSIVSLNYDLLFELCANYFEDPAVYRPNFKKLSRSEIDANWEQPALAKLHGSIDDDSIIPPSWSKNFRDPIIKANWKLAYKILSEATQIRILGFSMPETDSHLKYLIKSALLKNEHLKTVDVICLDADGSVQKKYQQFFVQSRLNFVNDSVEEFLLEIEKKYEDVTRERNDSVRFNALYLENAHKEIMKNRDRK